MNVKPKFVYYDIRRKQSVCLIMYTHENDVDTQVLEVSMLDNGEPIELDADYTYSAAIVNRETKALINDNISCELNDSGNVLIPIDNFHTLGAQDLLIELTITDSAGNQVLVTPFPLWIHVNASILDDAQVTPESEGTVPELLEEAKEALENAGDYENLENKPQINGHELSGNKTGDDLGLQNKLTAGENVTIDENGNISAEAGTLKYYVDSRVDTGKLLSELPWLFNAKYISIVTTSSGRYFSVGENVLVHSEDSYRITDVSTLNNAPINRIIPITGENLDFFLPLNSRYGLLVTLGFKSAGLRTQFVVTSDQKLYLRRFLVTDTARPVWVGASPTIASVTVDQNSRIMLTMPDGSAITSTGATLENVLNKVTSIDSSSTHTQYPSAKAVYDIVQNIEPTQITSATVNQNGTITFTMSDGSTVTTTGESIIGPQGPAGADGDAYVLTAQDKSDIAAIVLSELPTTQGVQYGNSND